ncbi:MAG: hypothetical protein AAGL92_13470 [Pseudomonadota bacterium]
MSDWKPLPGEDAKSYIERVGGCDGANIEMMEVLQSEFGYAHGDAKTLSLTSSSFWMNFFRSKLASMHAVGNKRATALRFIEKRNSDWGIGKPTLTPSEIDQLLDEFGDWQD